MSVFAFASRSRSSNEAQDWLTDHFAGARTALPADLRDTYVFLHKTEAEVREIAAAAETIAGCRAPRGIECSYDLGGEQLSFQVVFAKAQEVARKVAEAVRSGGYISAVDVPPAKVWIRAATELAKCRYAEDTGERVCISNAQWLQFVIPFIASHGNKCLKYRDAFD